MDTGQKKKVKKDTLYQDTMLLPVAWKFFFINLILQ